MITYLRGDATNPTLPGAKIIAHVCNDVGGWGHGFVIPLSQRWPLAETSYRQWHVERGNDGWPPFTLGQTVFVPVAPEIYVANMIAQRGIRKRGNSAPAIRYDALEVCLRDVERWALSNDHASVHMPRIGCGLAGGSWVKVEAIIDRVLVDVDTYVYDLDASVEMNIGPAKG